MELNDVFITEVVLTLEEALSEVAVTLGERYIYIRLVELGMEWTFCVICLSGLEIMVLEKTYSRRLFSCMQLHQRATRVTSGLAC